MHKRAKVLTRFVLIKDNCIAESHNATCYDKLPALEKKKSSYILYDEKKGIQTKHGTDARDIRWV